MTNGRSTSRRTALQEWKNDQIRLIKAGYTHTYELLKQHDGKTAITILIKMMPTDGSYPLQKYLQDYLSKITSHNELEEELVAELHRLV